MCVYVRCPNLLIQPFLTVTSQIVLHNLMKIFFSLSKVYTNTLLVYYCRFKKLSGGTHVSYHKADSFTNDLNLLEQFQFKAFLEKLQTSQVSFVSVLHIKQLFFTFLSSG